ncbi:hypothetical protein CYK58_04040 [Helicobacter pylori]|nr:hypothetical protein CYK58_04040 [Helicobacter pylori]
MKKGIRGYKGGIKTSASLYPIYPKIPPKKQKNHRAKPLKPLRKFKILSFRGVFLKNLGFL